MVRDIDPYLDKNLRERKVEDDEMDLWEAAFIDGYMDDY